MFVRLVSTGLRRSKPLRSITGRAQWSRQPSSVDWTRNGRWLSGGGHKKRGNDDLDDDEGFYSDARGMEQDNDEGDFNISDEELTAMAEEVLFSKEFREFERKRDDLVKKSQFVKSGQGNGLKYGVCSLMNVTDVGNGVAVNNDTYVAHFGLGDLADLSLFGVFDGWSGDHVSRRVEAFLAEEIVATSEFQSVTGAGEGEENAVRLRNAIKKAFILLDAKLVREDSIPSKCGCTASVVLTTPTHIIVTNAGDSRTVIGEGEHVILPQNPRQPHERPLAPHGPRHYRDDKLEKTVEVYRGFGGAYYKSNPVIASHFQSFSFVAPRSSIVKRASDRVVVIASGRIWNVVAVDEALKHMRHLVSRGKDQPKFKMGPVAEQFSKFAKQGRQIQESVTCIAIYTQE